MLLSALLKNYPEVSCASIDDSEYLLSQYADNSTLILDDNERSLHLFDCFSVYAGLKVNLDTNEAIWVGPIKGGNEKLLLEKIFPGIRMGNLNF